MLQPGPQAPPPPTAPLRSPSSYARAPCLLAAALVRLQQRGPREQADLAAPRQHHLPQPLGVGPPDHHHQLVVEELLLQLALDGRRLCLDHLLGPALEAAVPLAHLL